MLILSDLKVEPFVRHWILSYYIVTAEMNGKNNSKIGGKISWKCTVIMIMEFWHSSVGVWKEKLRSLNFTGYFQAYIVPEVQYIFMALFCFCFGTSWFMLVRVTLSLINSINVYMYSFDTSVQTNCTSCTYVASRLWLKQQKFPLFMRMVDI